jgi:hypothetical protein
MLAVLGLASDEKARNSRFMLAQKDERGRHLAILIISISQARQSGKAAILPRHRAGFRSHQRIKAGWR